ncbi:MAG: mechanosensitive ion channel domain-containing protein [Streptosporangiaceae bacterium]
MHPPNGIDLSAQVALVRRKTRPWKAIIALVLAIAVAVFSLDTRYDTHSIYTASHATHRLVADSASVLFCVFALIATFELAGKSRQLLVAKAGVPHAAIVRYVILIVGAFATLVITLELFTVPIGQLVLGGALTSVFVGIAAQQALSNVFAGLVLLFARPFQVGDAIRLRAGALGGQLDGIVTDIGITYVRFDTGGSVMSVPNSQVLNAMVGPIPAEDGANGNSSPVPAMASSGKQDPAIAGDSKQDPAVAGDGKSGTPGGPEQQQPGPPGTT